MIHGGELADARAHGGDGPILDLSTGINPHAYPAAFAPDVLRPLPQREADDRLRDAARRAYHVPDDADIVAAPGTQAILQWLPHCLPATRVTVIGPTYQEHAAIWSRHAPTTTVPTIDDAPATGLTVIVNPNNPDGRFVAADRLAAHAAATQSEAIALVVDEAFGDLAPERTAAGTARTLVLKSFGKFYGLAGLRLGFAIGPAEAIAPLRAALGPWAVSGPALEIGARALADAPWAAAMRERLARERAELDGALATAGLTVVGGTDLFRLVETEDAAAWHAALAREGIWTRIFPTHPRRLRIGLPGEALPRLEAALAHIGERPE
ncbi:threonine-phosphate decarboxylase CobD [Acuticoccus sp. M5D2P5]|nr:threonine-phosphate decarboxylase CobD [Acuticoccus kalidii]